MSSSEKIFLIVNPTAGKGKITARWGQVMELLLKHGIPYEHAFTNAKGHAGVLVREALLAGFRKLLVVGGDGTLNEVLNGVFHQQKVPSQEVTLVALPIGSGNDWARMHKLSQNLMLYFKQWKNLKSIRHDVGRVRYLVDGEKHSRYFLNISGFGFEGQVVKNLETFKYKLSIPSLAYLVGLLTSLFKYKEISLSLRVDSQKIETEVFNLSIGNGEYFGNGMRILPNAQPNDGLFDISLVEKIGRRKVITNLEKLFSGRYTNLPEVQTMLASTVLVEGRTPFWGETDGEPLPPSDFFEVEILPRAIRVLSLWEGDGLSLPPAEVLH